MSVPTDISTTTEASSLDCHFCGVDSPPVLFKDQKNEETKTPLETGFDLHTKAVYRRHFLHHRSSIAPQAWPEKLTGLDSANRKNKKCPS